MKRLLTALILTCSLGCSGDPEPTDAVVINFEDQTAQQTPADAGGDDMSDDVAVEEPAPEDMSVPDVGEPPDMFVEVEPSGTQCQAKDAPIQLSRTCTFEWDACSDSGNYAFVCNIQNVGGNVFSLCNCYENGVKDEADKIVSICGLSDWAEVEVIVNEQCGWDLR